MAKPQEQVILDSEIKTILAEDVHFVGSLKFKESLKINGVLEGSIQAEEGDLYIGENASVKADIITNQLTHLGKIIGKVEVRKSLEIFAGAKLKGDISVKELMIQKGGLFDGNCIMSKDSSSSSDS